MFRRILIVLVVLSVSSVFACTIDGTKGIVEDNNLWISPNAKNVNKIDEVEFNRVIDKVVKVYEPIIVAEGVKLKVERKWSDGTVNAFASRKWGKWVISMFGGLARHEAITADGFTLVVCHEIGHHIGGAPKKTKSMGRNGTRKRWATNEGQADYWATLKCLRKVWQGDNHANILAAMEVPEVVSKKCESQFSDTEQRLLCQRSTIAGLSVAKLFQTLRKEPTAPDFKTPDTHVVAKNYHNHPATQCRLDSYYHGALCSVSEFSDVDQEDAMAGNCNRADGEIIGVRPLCWFKPE